MIATPRGKDYLKATLVLSVVASLLDVKILVALSFALATMGLISFIFVSKIIGRSESVEMNPTVLRGFKGEDLYSSVELFTRHERWLSMKILDVEAPEGLEVEYSSVRPNVARIAFRPRYAGSFRGTKVRVEVRDTLGLFAKTFLLTHAEFAIEALPVALLVPLPRPRPFLLALGERTAGTRGSGQEFYSIDEYSPSIETKDVLWKRVARMSEEKLVVRIRESNIPKKVSVGILEAARRGRRDRLEWIDLVSEAVGLIGRNLLAVRCRLEITHRGYGGLVESVGVSDLEELADALISISATPPPFDDGTRSSVSILSESDVVVTGLREIEDTSVAIAVTRKPALLISEADATPSIVGEQSLIFTGSEDVRNLVLRAVER